jgi:hypothetical protein
MMPEPEIEELSWEDKKLLVETTLWLLISRLAILILPMRWILRSCGTQYAQSTESITEEQRVTVERIAWAIDAVRWITPWDSNCLARSVAGKRLLQRRGLTSTLYLGVSKSTPQTLIAHAWLRCGDQYVTGNPRQNTYTVVSTFAEE